jgi:hypothetical protein
MNEELRPEFIEKLKRRCASSRFCSFLPLLFYRPFKGSEICSDITLSEADKLSSQLRIFADSAWSLPFTASACVLFSLSISDVTITTWCFSLIAREVAASHEPMPYDIPFQDHETRT